ncbi:helix-turn-helix domain-containing protein [Kaistella yonginensis]|uniref:helix-turn-helix domain-containing protein n=1 Tax=Kaistella yonginensis TaxID=658267 RepID=UPI0025B35B20|nr:AraC family transcriptional regulator [Kaistella yonginensis]MDN3606570.1 AraC family transcriptional regulator [Kaistella yonginensis]
MKINFYIYFQSDKEDLFENILKDIETTISIEEIAFKNDISRQYLNQYFKLKLGKSPSEFRKIARFRKSLTMMKNRNTALTEVSYENLFFDQSHFNRDFKELTHFSPKEFSQNTDLEKNNVWFII